MKSNLYNLEPQCFADSVLVLRDWIEQHTDRCDVGRLNEWAICAHGAVAGAPIDLLALARAEAETTVRKRFAPAALEAEVRQKFARARTGLIAKDRIAAALELHIEALYLAARWGIDRVAAVATKVIGQINPGAKADTLTLCDVDRTLILRTGESGEHARIYLPRGWRREQRKRGVRPPWSTLPSGWALSGHERWAMRPLEVGGER